MRAIKFRAWNGKVICPVTSIGWEDEELVWYDKVLGYWANESHESNRRHLDGVLMQYTGLKDKNGREIYEDDILKWEVVGPLGPWQEIFTVEIPGIYYAEADENWPGGLEEKDCEIIGNIYENPELVPSEKEK